MKKKKFLCVDLDVYTQKSNLQVGESKIGMLAMTEDNEHFVFEETTPTKCKRNAKLWSGHRINVKRNMFGQLCVYFRHLHLTNELNVRMVSKEIMHELATAMEELGV